MHAGPRLRQCWVLVPLVLGFEAPSETCSARTLTIQLQECVTLPRGDLELEHPLAADSRGSRLRHLPFLDRLPDLITGALDAEARRGRLGLHGGLIAVDLGDPVDRTSRTLSAE